MDWSAWGGTIAACMLFLAATGWIVRLTLALSKADSKADKAEAKADSAVLTASALRVAIEQVERDLVEHRVSVAREYVSNQMLASFEKKLIDAIDRIGSRLDSLFVPRTTPPTIAG